jgi:hypothetical protein
MAVVAMFFLGRIVRDARVGVLAAVLLALNEYHLGISHSCFQKNYMTFAIAGAWLFLRALNAGSIRNWTAFGCVMGLGCATGITVAVWAPVMVLTMLIRSEGRKQFKTMGPWLACGIVLAMLSPYLLRDLGLAQSGGSGLLFQLAKFKPFVWSWAPTALFIRPLYYNVVEGTISEYVSMTTLTGTLVLLGGISGFFIRDWRARFILALGWWPFAFFSLFSRPDGEFFWSDFSLPAFILLTSATAFRFGGAAKHVAAALVLVHAWFAIPVVRATERYFPLEWGKPPPSVVQRYRNSQRSMLAAFKSRDYAKLTSCGTWHLPMRGWYLESLEAYALKLNENVPDGQLAYEGWLAPGAIRAREKEWVAQALDGFEERE